MKRRNRPRYSIRENEGVIDMSSHYGMPPKSFIQFGYRDMPRPGKPSVRQWYATANDGANVVCSMLASTKMEAIFKAHEALLISCGVLCHNN